MIDPNLVKAANTYDAFGRLTQTTLSDKNAVAIGKPTQSAWTKCSAGSCPGGVGEDGNEALAAWRVTTVHAGAPSQVSWFDVLGRPIKQASGNFDESLVATLTDYDALGTVALQSTPYKIGLTTPTFTSTAYDAMGRPTVKVLTGSSLDSANGNQVREYAYSGRTTTVTVRAANRVLDANGNCPSGSGNLCFKISRRSNTLGQLMHTADANNGATDFWPGANGPLVAMTDAEGNRTQATVNELGQRTQSIDPDQGTWKFTYDALGELLTQTDARGAKTTITARDALGRTKNRTIVPPASLPSGMSNAVFADSWSYDPVNGKGLLDTTTRKRGTDPNNPTSGPVVWQEATAYDIQARTKTVTTTIADGGTQTLAYDQTYDTYNRPQTTTYPSNLKVETRYTAYGQRSELRNAETLVSYWVGSTVDAWGHITSDGSANGVAGNYVFDPDTGQATSRSWTKNAAAVTSVAYGYDSFANLRSQSRASNTETYLYDPLQRLTSATRTNGGVTNYGYTASGNLSKKDDYSTNVGGAYSYAPANSLVNLCGPHAVNAVALNAANGSGNATFACDANGNVIGGSTITTASFAADNKPVSITRGGTPAVPDPSCATSIADRLFCRGFQPATPASGGASQTWAYASDGSKVYETSSRGSTWFGRFGYEKNGNTLRHELGPVVVARNGGVDTVTTILSDRLGSTVATVDGAGTNERAYDAFGQVRNGNMTNKSPATLALNSTIHGFTQHKHADDVRLIHMGGRVFDSALGRFLSVDPVIQNPSNTQSLNPYSYIGNNPLSGTDPTGYTACDDVRIEKGGSGTCDFTGKDGKTSRVGYSIGSEKVALGGANNMSAISAAASVGVLQSSGSDAMGRRGRTPRLRDETRSTLAAWRNR